MHESHETKQKKNVKWCVRFNFFFTVIRLKMMTDTFFSQKFIIYFHLDGQIVDINEITETEREKEKESFQGFRKN